MKFLKFYYYSPKKMKLVPIKNFYTKTSVIIFSITLMSIFFTYFSHASSPSASQIIEYQEQVVNNEFQNELIKLEAKYEQLAQDYRKLINSSNDLRNVLNLEKIKINPTNFGIGGSTFNDDNLSVLLTNNDNLETIYGLVNSIETSVKFEKGNYTQIQNKLNDNKEFYKRVPAIKPVNSSYGDRFGMRFHPILKHRRMHHGLDFLSNVGEQVYAPGDGTVTYIGSKGGYGKVVRINHGYGYETIFAHLSKYKVKKGQKVKRGDLIAISGNSGSLSTGPHLHYEVRHNGISLNPRNFIFEDLRLFDSPKFASAK